MMHIGANYMHKKDNLWIFRVVNIDCFLSLNLLTHIWNIGLKFQISSQNLFIWELSILRSKYLPQIARSTCNLNWVIVKYSSSDSQKSVLRLFDRNSHSQVIFIVLDRSTFPRKNISDRTLDSKKFWYTWI